MLLAQSIPQGDQLTSAITTIVQYGSGGLIAYLLITGKLVAAKHYAEMKADRDAARGELATLRTKLDEQVLPLLTRSTDLLTKLAERRRGE